MTPAPAMVHEASTVTDAARIMAESDIGAIPVVDTDRVLLGIVTDRDIIVRVVAEGRNPDATHVGEIASTHVSAAYPEEPLSEAVEQMAFRQVRRLPVVEDDRVVGMLAQADVVLGVKDRTAGQLVTAISAQLEPEPMAHAH
jgi:CBS domain-containing protein